MPQPPERCFGIVWCYPLLFHCDIFVPRAHNAVLDMRLSPVDGILVDGHLGDGGIRGDVVHDRDKQIFDHAAQTARTALALHRLAGDGMQGCIGKDQLVFTDAALHAIARKTVERKSGARGLRSVVEDLLIPIMYDIPSDATITKVTIDEDTVNGGEPHVEHGIMRPRYKNIAMKQ